ncbi:MAG: transcription termination factor NusA [Candidatus Pacebacteria bacterium]|nr:transcription termination factor NusA [Candidatus Paceibacterota bacterium]NUQ56998.1 transcription termination/antitermination protein NusA [Candidatus Paceibacter sp.]
MDLKALQTALHQLETERGIPKDKIVRTIEDALAAAYKKDYGKKGQIIRAVFNPENGEMSFSQIKYIVDESMLKTEEEGDEPAHEEAPVAMAEGEIKKVRFNPEHHIMLDEAKKIKKTVQPGEEMVFPLETKENYGMIAAQTAKQVIIQRIREAEKESIYGEYKNRQGEIISGIVQRMEAGNVFVDLGRATAMLPRDEQIRGERYRIGERTRALLFLVEETPRGINLFLSRSHPRFIAKLFEMEIPEITSGAVEIKNIAREPGSRSKIAVVSKQDGIDPVGSCVGQKGVRISTIISELGGEKIDIIEWSENPEDVIANSLSPAKIIEVKADPKTRVAEVTVDEDQLSLAIGKMGQNVRLAAKLTGWKIDIKSRAGETVAEANEEGEVTEKTKETV